VSFLVYYVSNSSTSFSELLTAKLFLRRFISFIETAAVTIPPKINPIQKKIIITGSILKTSEDAFYNY
ncbi:MAG: hypothetical protein WBG28_07135, partial [Desulfobulbales bacterium]